MQDTGARERFHRAEVWRGWTCRPPSRLVGEAEQEALPAVRRVRHRRPPCRARRTRPDPEHRRTFNPLRSWLADGTMR